MKKSIPFLLFIVILLSCSDSKTPETNGNAKDSLRNQVSFLSGTWVTSGYIDELEKTKSPFRAYDQLNGIVLMSFDTSAIKGDSLNVGISWNNHEGGGFELYFQKGSRDNSLRTSIPDYDVKTNYYELELGMDSKDTTITLSHYDKNKIILDRRKFTRVLTTASNEDLGYGIQYIVNKKLVAGDYEMIDSMGHSSGIIHLSEKGKLTGMKEFNTFSVFTDFMGPDTLDNISFQKDSKEGDYYVFRIHNDTIKLFEQSGSEESGEVFTGPLKYQLIKKKL